MADLCFYLFIKVEVNFLKVVFNPILTFYRVNQQSLNENKTIKNIFF